MPLYDNDPLSDPRNVGLLYTGLSLMAGSGPSRYPRGLGPIIGEAGQQGLQAYQQARQAQMVDTLRRAQLLKLQRESQEAEESRRIRGALFGDLYGSGAPGLYGSGAPGTSGADPERVDRLGTYLALKGDPGAATLLSTADRLRKRQEEVAAAESFKSKPGTLGAGVTTTSPQGQALLSNLTGEQDFDNAALLAQNEALNSNTRLAPQPIQAPRQGLYGPLSESPYVGDTARALQSQLDAAKHVSPQQWLTQLNALQQQHMTASNQAAARRENADLRRELAGDNAELRRELAGANAGLRRELTAARTDTQRDRDRATREQRTFTRENQLADDYNNLSRDFRKTLPHFQSAAQYMAGGKFDSSGDRAMVFQYAKMLDPMDRVGVNDLRDINKLGNVPERIVQAVNGLMAGKELPERVRQEMFSVMRSRFEAMNEAQMQVEDEYEERAKRNMLNPQNIVIRHAARRNGGRASRGATGGWSVREK